MRTIFLALILILTIGSVVAGELTEGQKAPNFSLPGSDGQTYTLDQFSGEKPVIIAWFPKAFTGG